MEVIINPGSGKVTDSGYLQAYNNTLKFIEDCEIPLIIISSNCIAEENGRYSFKLKSPLVCDMEWEVEMPSLPLDQVRYIDSESQNIWDFPRLYVDGSSWVWKFAIIKRKETIERLKDRNDDYKAMIGQNEKLIKELEK